MGGRCDGTLRSQGGGGGGGVEGGVQVCWYLAESREQFRLSGSLTYVLHDEVCVCV